MAAAADTVLTKDAAIKAADGISFQLMMKGARPGERMGPFPVMSSPEEEEGSFTGRETE